MKLISERIFLNALNMIAIAILLGIGVQAYYQSNRIHEASHWVVHTHSVIETANQIEILQTRASVIAAHAFLYNKENTVDDDKTLTDINLQTKNNMIGIALLTQDNPAQQNRIKELNTLIITKYSYTNNIMNEINHSKKDQAVADISNQKVIDLNDRIRIVLQNIIDEEIKLLHERNSVYEYEYARESFDLGYVIAVCLIILLTSFALINHLLSRQIRIDAKIKKSEQEVLAINKQLKESEDRYHLAITSGKVGLWDWDLVTNEVFYSPYLKEMLGYTEEEFKNTTEMYFSRLHPNDLERLKKHYKEHVKSHIPFHIEYRMQNKSGIYNWFEVTGQVIRDENGKPKRMLGGIFDISDRKRTESRLHIQNAVNKTFSQAKSFESLSHEIAEIICVNMHVAFSGVWLKDEVKDELHCVSTWQQSEKTAPFNDARRVFVFARGIGLPGRILASGASAWIEDIQADANYTFRALAKTVNLRSAFGFPIMMDDNVIGIIEFISADYMFIDQQLLDLMTTIGLQMGLYLQQRKAENKLQLSESYKNAILESASDSIVTINGKGNLISCNAQTRKLFAYPDDSFKKQGINCLIPNLTSSITLLTNTKSHELKGKKANGDEFPIEISITKMEKKKEQRYVIFARDITERKRIDVMKNEFISVVSHELRTPLTSIRGSISLLLGGKIGQFSEKATNLLNIANNNCDRLLLLINDILDIEKIESGKMQFRMQDIDLCHIVKESIKNNAMYAEKYQVTLNLITSLDEAHVRGDADRLSQVLANLISNAVKFSHSGGQVEIIIKQRENHTRVEVTDHGSGIPKEFQSRIFQKFSQADSSTTRVKGGSGLGLNISRSLIEKHDGTLNFHSIPGEGATFYFELPELNAKSLIKQAEQTGKNKVTKLLLCEDDEDQVLFLQSLLETEGMYADVAQTVSQAREMLAKNEYYAILMDLILPDIDGITFIRELKQNEKTRRLPIIVISVIAQTGRSMLNGNAFHVLDWMDKPIDGQRLLQSIKNLKTNIPTPRILHIEDDHDTQTLVATLLEEFADVTSVGSIKEADTLIRNNKYDLVVLDLVLPDGSGTTLFNICSEYKLPILVYSNYTLDKEYAQHVKDKLNKATTTNKKLLNTIKELLP